MADAYEEVEEQRQVVGQWKRKVQKMTNEMNDLRMLLEEQNSRNNLLEKRQRKFDIECQALQVGVGAGGGGGDGATTRQIHSIARQFFHFIVCLPCICRVFAYVGRILYFAVVA